MTHHQVHPLLRGHRLVDIIKRGNAYADEIEWNGIRTSGCKITKILKYESDFFRGGIVEEPAMEGQRVLKAACHMGHNVFMSFRVINELEVVGLKRVELSKQLTWRENNDCEKTPETLDGRPQRPGDPIRVRCMSEICKQDRCFLTEDTTNEKEMPALLPVPSPLSTRLRAAHDQTAAGVYKPDFDGVLLAHRALKRSAAQCRLECRICER